MKKRVFFCKNTRYFLPEKWTTLNRHVIIINGKYCLFIIYQGGHITNGKKNENHGW